MLQLNPAPLDSQDLKIELNNNKNRTLKNKKQVKFNENDDTNNEININNDLKGDINRNDFNFSYNSTNNNNPNANNKKIKDLSNLISKLHNKDECGEEIMNIHYTILLINTSNKFLDNTEI